jgi:ATP-binding cassette subfamily A (ABC1) protein 5
MSLFINQLKAVTYRNFLLKKYNKRKTFQEIFIPIYLILIIFAVKSAVKFKFYEDKDASIQGNISSFWGPLENENTIGFILPENSNDEIINKIMNTPILKNYKSLRFENEDQLVKYNEDQNNLIAGIVFDNDLFTYTIRINGTSVPDSEADAISNYGRSRVAGEESTSYLTKFSYLQSVIDTSIINLKTNISITVDTDIGILGRAGIRASQGNIASNKIYSLYMNFLFLGHILIIITFLVEEKEKKIKEGMLMSGVHPSIFWLSWEIVYFVLICVTCILITAFLVLTKSYEFINPVILFIILILYGLSNCSMGFIISTFFKKSKTATSFTGAFTSLIFILYFAVSYLNKSLKMIFCIFLSPITFGLTMEEIGIKEDLTEKITFGNLFSSDIGKNIVILVINNILYLIMAIVFDYFLDEYSTFRLKKVSKLSVEEEESKEYEQDIEEDTRRNEKSLVEVSNVSKVFKRTVTENNDENRKEKKKNIFSKNDETEESFLAVNHVNFKAYKNEIFAILGHNGAGKTTLIQIMIGLISASGGNVYFDGNDISSNTTKIHQQFGVCSQSSILFDELTVEDHIKIFAKIKNVEVDIDQVLKEVDLEQKKEDKVINLSGGQKRKLCIAIAVIGNPRYIFLDEPTTGLDPLSRRKIWDLLLKKKEGRIIFLTTHYMDEADILADRKLILNHGKIRCLGTSLYLKNHFNMEYSLDIESPSCDKVDTLIRKYIPESSYDKRDNEKQIKNSDIEMRTWKLPISSTTKFSDLFNEIEQYTGENNLIRNYALSMPTLEELFIRLEEENPESSKNINSNIKNDTFTINMHEELPKLEKVKEISNFQKILYLIQFRLKIFFHNKTFSSSALLVPVIVSILTFVIIKLMNNIQIKEFKSIEISPNMYNDSVWNINTNDLNIPNFTKDLYSSIIKGKMTEYSDKELNNISKTIDKEPYYVSSISGVLNNNNNYKFNVYYNISMTHSLPATMNAISNSILASKNINERIVTKSQPFSYANYIYLTVSTIIIGIYLGAAFLSGSSIYGPLMVRERVNQLLQQLQLNGISRFNYWISALISDNFLFLITCFMVIIVGAIFQPSCFLNVYNLIIIIITLLFWSSCTIIYQYILSFAFGKEDTANSFMPLINLLPSYVGVIIFSLINSLNVSYDPTKIFSTAAILVEIVITLINPPYAIMGILNALFTVDFYKNLLHMDTGFGFLLRFHSGISPLLITVIVIIPFYFFILLSLDNIKNQTNAKDIYTPDHETIQKNEAIISNGDKDVYHEYLSIKENYEMFPISTIQLCKEYKVNLSRNPEKRKAIDSKETNYKFGDIHKSKYGKNNYVKTAVEDVSFGINRHECFGLLGPNGAGKSTTLNMVTSTIPQTTGRIYYDGVESYAARLNEISLGYCPQNDIYWKELTIREHIEFFLRIRGYPSYKVKEYTDHYIRCCKLEEHQNKRASKLSGGTKRKLCLLVAICGYPNQILLDEPTAGMDPSTRRYVWNIIKGTKNNNNSAIIMTTHSMEEAENLCDRIGILINGRLVCIGSPEHIKMKYGNSYNLEVQSRNIETFHKRIIEENKLLGEDYKKEDKSYDRINYEISLQKGVGKIFKIMENCKKEGLISDYSFSQTTLEQVFINFAKLQVTENEN